MFARRIAVVGTGYVGLTTGACLASLGHQVVCGDIDAAKVGRLCRGVVDIVEPGLAELVAEQVSAGRLSFVVGAAAAVTGFDSDPAGPGDAGAGHAEVLFLCVPTPMGVGGVADLRAVEAVVEEVGALLASGTVVVNKSTVPVGTAVRTQEMLAWTRSELAPGDRSDVAVVSNPEFLREGSAVSDFLGPDRIVVGSDNQDAAERVAALYARLGAPTVLTDAASAELMKYAANCFLAMKLSYVNAMAELCERVGADITDVTEGIGYDRRIGQAFLSPGPGWGGSCLPKDTHALLQVADAADFEFRLLRATIDTNVRQQQRIVDKVRLAVTGRRTGSLSRVRLCLLGLTFKAGTDDLRDSPALAIAALLRQAGAELVGFDPALSEKVSDRADSGAADGDGVDGDPAGPAGAVELAGITLAPDAVTAAQGAEAAIVLTEWPVFRVLDWSSMAGAMKRPIVVDTRNLVDPATLRRAGLTPIGLGRGTDPSTDRPAVSSPA